MTRLNLDEPGAYEGSNSQVLEQSVPIRVVESDDRPSMEVGWIGCGQQLAPGLSTSDAGLRLRHEHLPPSRYQNPAGSTSQHRCWYTASLGVRKWSRAFVAFTT
jgi:hypothetical protein